jgi:hypothetical protein
MGPHDSYVLALRREFLDTYGLNTRWPAGEVMVQLLDVNRVTATVTLTPEGWVFGHGPEPRTLPAETSVKALARAVVEENGLV